MAGLEKGDPKALDAYDDAMEAFLTAGGYEMESRAKAILLGLGFSVALARRPGRHALRRLGDAAGAGRFARLRARPAPARRADEPPRPAQRQVVRGLPPLLPRRDPDHLPRPRLPRPGHHQDLRARDGQAVHAYTGNYSAYLPQKEHRISIQQAMYRRPAEEDQGDAGLRRPQQGPGVDRLPSPEPRQGDREDRSRRRPADRQLDHADQAARAPPVRPGRRQARRRWLRLRHQGRLLPARPGDPARRPRRPRRSQRRGQDDPDEAPLRRPLADPGRGRAGQQTSLRPTSPSTASRRST